MIKKTIKLTTVEEVYTFMALNYIPFLDKCNVPEEASYFYFCNFLKELKSNKNISSIVYLKALIYLKQNYPTEEQHTSFYNKKAFYKRIYSEKNKVPIDSWWHVFTKSTDTLGEDTKLINEKQRFLNVLVKQLNS